MKVEELLNVTFDETPPPPKTSPLEDDKLVEEEAIEGRKLCTIVDTLTQWEPHSMLAATFSGRHTIFKALWSCGRNGNCEKFIRDWVERDVGLIMGVSPDIVDEIDTLSEIDDNECMTEFSYFEENGLKVLTCQRHRCLSIDNAPCTRVVISKGCEKRTVHNKKSKRVLQFIEILEKIHEISKELCTST
ncbi:hypothetical protein Tco_0745105 [Tanacetum coccineum]